MTKDREEFVDVKFESLLAQTHKAFLVDVEGEEFWVGKAQVDNCAELEEELAKPVSKRGGVDTISVPRWIAIQNGWIDE